MDGLVMILGMNTSKLHNQQKQIELELVSSLWLDLTNGFSGRISPDTAGCPQQIEFLSQNSDL